MCAHMCSQRRSPGKSLFADGILALVWTFAGVRSSVPCKRARVAERLVTSRILAAVWFLPSVYPHMYIQCRALRIRISLHAAGTENMSEYLNELLPATWLNAFKWSLASVYAYVSEQIAPPCEPLSTFLARVWLFLAI
jgi:hypothetical protein